MEKHIIKRVVIRRLCELMITAVVLSAAVAGMLFMGVLNTDSRVLFGMLAGVALFEMINTVFLRHCYFDLLGKKIYYLSNLFAYFIFIFITATVYFVDPETIYLWLFGISEFAKYSEAEFAVWFSAALFHAIGIALVFVAPAGMKGVVRFLDDQYGYGR